MERLYRPIFFAAVSVFGAGAWAAPQTVTLKVPGMDCAACPITIKRALQRVVGVTQVDVSFANRKAVVRFDDALTSTAQLTLAVAHAGFVATLAGDQP